MSHSWKFNFVSFLRHFLLNISTDQCSKLTELFHCCFLNAEAAPMYMCWFNFYFQPNINTEKILGHRHWTDIILLMLFQRCFVNAETTSINVCRLNFHFQLNINVKTTLINVDDQRCFNVGSMLMCFLGNYPANSKQKMLYGRCS